MTDDEIYLERKEKLVYKEFETGFGNYQKLEGKVASLRQWTITINVGLVLYLLSNNHNLLTLFSVIFVFMSIILILELRERSSMKFDKDNILLLENIFNEKNYQKYKDSIDVYIFRDLRLSKLNARTKLKHYTKSLYKGEVIVWYGMWLFVWIGLILIKKWTWFNEEIIISRLWVLIVIIVVFLIFASMLFYKYFKTSKPNTTEI